MQSRKLIEELVSFDTTSHLSNLELIRFIENHLDNHGVASRLIYNADKTKANLFATVGNPGQPGILLSGHTDVVPVDGQDWSFDPFRVRENDNRLFGRGCADMKSFIAIVLSFVPAMTKADLKLPLHMSFSYDEEVGCIGVRSLIDKLKEAPVLPRFCIVGEPTEMRVINGHKGKVAYQVCVDGQECHSALAVTDGVNAVEYAADLIVFIKSLQGEIADNGPFDPDYDVAYTTLNTGPISGGRVLNIIPDNCEFEFEIRNIPADDPQVYIDKITNFADTALKPGMRKIHRNSDIEFFEIASYPGLYTHPDSEVVSFVKSLATGSGTARINFGTEGGLFHNINIPTVICGPGSINQAHKPDEFITFEQISRCEKFMKNLISFMADSDCQ